ncbi:unnamed protein product [Xylocopa violacea]|uniref:Uncharacterized protein n=1 Tax=Xylocopa violacea TaxID=135666 RepID=A0ABP1NC54_XYLVO
MTDDIQAYIFRSYIGKFGIDILNKIITNDMDGDNINILVEKLDKYFDPQKNKLQIQPPRALSDKGDLAENWITWKQEFQMFLEVRKLENKSKNLQAIMLTNYIGKFGQNIIDKIITDIKEKSNVDILLQRLDEYFDSSKNNKTYIPPPDPLSNNGDMTQNWMKWKKDFLMYLKATGGTNKPKDFQVHLLRDYIGKFGQDIIEKIDIDLKERDDINILLQRLDKYFDSSKTVVNKYLPLPVALSNSGDVLQNWMKWKKDFLLCMQTNGHVNTNYQAYLLRKCIGKFGQDIIEKIVTDSKERNDINMLLQRLDKYFDSSKNNVTTYLPPPGPLPNNGDMAQNWMKWKKDFLMYLKATDATSKPNDVQAYLLRNCIGKFGQDIIEKIVTDSKEKDDINKLVQKLDKYFDSSKNNVTTYLPPPGPLSNNGDMAQNWMKWKKDFLMYLKATDATSKPNDVQAYLLRNCIGKFGQDIIEKIVTDSKEKDDINKLVQKLDKYFDWSKNEVVQRYNFFKTVKKPDVSIEDYIIDLKVKAATCNFGKLMDSLIRDKIIIELNDKYLKTKLLSEENLNLLKLRTIYNEHQSRNHNNTVPNDSTTSNETKNFNQHKKWNCKKCDQRHKLKACPAWGVKCEKCGTYNHFTKCCPHDFANDGNSTASVSTVIAHSHETNSQWVTTQPTAPPPFECSDDGNTLYPRLDRLKAIEINTESTQSRPGMEKRNMKSDKHLQKQRTSSSLGAQSSTNENVPQAITEPNITKDKDEKPSDTSCRIS